MDPRHLKALELAARFRIVFDGGAWSVPSQTTSARYRVSIGDEPSCPCEDFALRQQPCKHILAARLVCSRELGAKGDSVLAAGPAPATRTYKQDWPRYNMAQATEKRRFRELLADLCRDLQPLPPPKTGRRPHRIEDTVFAMTYKVYSGFSRRRFGTDLADAHAAGLLSARVPGMKVCAFMEDARLTPVLRALIVRSSLPLRSVETTFAPDSTGFSTSRFVRWHDEKYGTERRSGRDWVKAHAICGVKTNIVTAVAIEGRDAGDSPQFKHLVGQTAENFTVKEVPADKAYLSHDNLALVESLGGTAYMPFKSNSMPGEPGSLWARTYHYYNLHREDFLKHYHQRSNVESTFSMVKAKFRDHVRSRTATAMRNEVLCKFLCHNICVAHQSHIELGLEPVFRLGEDGQGEGPAPPCLAAEDGSGRADRSGPGVDSPDPGRGTLE